MTIVAVEAGAITAPERDVQHVQLRLTHTSRIGVASYPHRRGPVLLRAWRPALGNQLSGMLRTHRDWRTLKAADGHPGECQKSPISIARAHAATGGKIGGITSIFLSETLALEPSQNVLRGPR